MKYLILGCSLRSRAPGLGTQAGQLRAYERIFTNFKILGLSGFSMDKWKRSLNDNQKFKSETEEWGLWRLDTDYHVMCCVIQEQRGQLTKPSYCGRTPQQRMCQPSRLSGFPTPCLRFAESHCRSTPEVHPLESSSKKPHFFQSLSWRKSLLPPILTFPRL